MIGPLPEDLLQERNFVEGSRMLLSAIEYYHNRAAHGLPQRPLPGQRFRWGRMAQPHEVTPKAAERRREVLARIEARDARADAQRTRRDPCFRCGTRGDHGCEHLGRQAI